LNREVYVIDRDIKQLLEAFDAYPTVMEINSIQEKVAFDRGIKVILRRLSI